MASLAEVKSQTSEMAPKSWRGAPVDGGSYRLAFRDRCRYLRRPSLTVARRRLEPVPSGVYCSRILGDRLMVGHKILILVI